MKNENLKGVGGWLGWIIFCFMVLGPLAAGSAIWKDIITTEHDYPGVLSNPNWGTFKTAYWLTWAAASGVGAYAGFLLWKRHAPPSVGFAKMALWLSGPIMLAVQSFVVVPLTLHVSMDAQSAGEAAGKIIGSALSAIVWTLYFSKSVRVKNTYGIAITQLDKFESSPSKAKWLKSTWDVGPLRNEGVRRLCIALNFVGIGLAVVLLIGAAATNDSFMVIGFVTFAVISYGLARGASWVIAGFAK
ncbi:DUF2569 family protein [Burkholderia stagnalis]|uniref:DUF2569 family protein n=1 Tax=Burkholderia stagnalis TaxID=1503054 RepID=UPI00325B3A23